MPIVLKGYEARVQQAVSHYWRTLDGQGKKQRTGNADRGGRAAVTGGKQMMGFCRLVQEVLTKNGVPAVHVFTEARLELPGYFRPTKQWDMLVVSGGQLIAALEFKSQRGPSFGNNFNNRTEEAIGTAQDLWTAYREQAFGKQPRPWLGWVMLLEDCKKSHAPVAVNEPHFKVFEEFHGASYAKRYELLLRRLVLEKLFDGSALLMATDKQGRKGRPSESIVMPELYQASLDLLSELPDSAYDYGVRSSGETHGVVLTKPHVVSLILDLAGYTADRDLTQLRLLEPSCGEGAFVVAAVERLMTVALREGIDLRRLPPPIVAFDIDQNHVEKTRAAVIATLEGFGIDTRSAHELAHRWIHRCDFLLRHEDQGFDVIVGNPPYVRIEQLTSGLQAEYRTRYRSLYDRADLYVAFIERALQLLSAHGFLSFICADRWIVNKYGAPLRDIITKSFRVASYVDLHSASPFESDVVAYPSIFAVTPGSGGPVQTCTLATASRSECEAAMAAIVSGTSSAPGVTVATYDSWFSGTEPWIITSPAHLIALRSLERRFPAIEASGRTRIRIGVATGDDKSYIVEGNANIERDRLVPLVMRSDIINGRIKDAQRFVINTFRDNGGVVDLRDYPRLAAYLETNEVAVRRRHVAQKNPSSWFRTIDRVYPHLVGTPKLLVPDIAGANEVVFEEGRFLPHHNLYFVTSDEWDMEVLGGLLSSKVALFFVWSYAVKMRGGYLRFQAQYLRRICVPIATDISPTLAEAIRTAFRGRDFVRLDELALEAYSLDALPEFDFVDTRS